jgi:hypothetical protein
MKKPPVEFGDFNSSHEEDEQTIGYDVTTVTKMRPLKRIENGAACIYKCRERQRLRRKMQAGDSI